MQISFCYVHYKTLAILGECKSLLPRKHGPGAPELLSCMKHLSKSKAKKQLVKVGDEQSRQIKQPNWQPFVTSHGNKSSLKARSAKPLQNAFEMNYRNKKEEEKLLNR